MLKDCPSWLTVAVQEERQRGKEKSDTEVESTCSFNEDMPVEKILDAELAVEPKTETHTEDSQGNSVSPQPVNGVDVRSLITLQAEITLMVYGSHHF